MYQTTKKEMTTTEFQNRMIESLSSIDDTLQNNQFAETCTYTGVSMIESQIMVMQAIDRQTAVLERIAKALEGSN